MTLAIIPFSESFREEQVFKKSNKKWLSFFVILLFTGCNNFSKDIKAPVEKDDKRKLGFGSIAGEDFLTIGGSNKNTASSSGLTINQYLWKASLQTLEFLPLTSSTLR